jgi:hypothetical protein
LVKQIFRFGGILSDSFGGERGITTSLRSVVIPQGGASKQSDQTFQVFLFFSNPFRKQASSGLFKNKKSLSRGI